MAIEKYSATWIGGFAEGAAELGLDKEAAEQLLRFAAMLENSGKPGFDESFRAEFDEQIKKAAVPEMSFLGHLGNAVSRFGGGVRKSPAAMMAAGAALPTAAAAGYYGLWRPYVGKGDFERHMQQLRDAAELGFMGDDEATQAMEQIRRQYAQQHIAGTGYRAIPSNAMGYGMGWSGMPSYTGYGAY